MSEWKTIDSAPKDGTEVLVAGFEYGDPSKARFVTGAAFLDGIWWDSGIPDHIALYPPTHWMPLPEPPKDAP